VREKLAVPPIADRQSLFANNEPRTVYRPRPMELPLNRSPTVALLCALLAALLFPMTLAHAADLVSGRAALPEHVATPAGAVLEVALVDLSALDEDEHLLGSLRIDNPGASPIAFTVPFDRTRIVAAHSYVVRAVLRVNGQLAYAGEEPLSAKAHFAGPAHVLLKPVDAAAPVATHALPGLVGPEWRVVEVDGQPVTATGRAEPFLLFADGERVSGMAGCNRVSGHYDAGEGTLHLDSLVSTRMACAPPAMTLETRLLAALGAAAGARISGDTLELRDAAGMLRVRLEARRAH